MVAREDKGILGVDWNKSPAVSHATSRDNIIRTQSPQSDDDALRSAFSTGDEIGSKTQVEVVCQSKLSGSRQEKVFKSVRRFTRNGTATSRTEGRYRQKCVVTSSLHAARVQTLSSKK